VVARVLAERIGGADSAKLMVIDGGGAASGGLRRLPDHAAALQATFEALVDQPIDAIGHRVVHGGSRYSLPERVTAELLDTLRELVSIDPAHLPQAIRAIEVAANLRPDVPQVACFDTAFHRSMPRIAQLYPLPRELAEAGVIRYGFHGLSYEYIVDQLRQIEPPAGRRVIVAHLGNGASMAAIRDGLSLDTTMGFTPTGGLMMGTRSGDLDPGVLLHLEIARSMNPADMSDLVNRRAGLLGVSDTSGDMRELLAAEQSEPEAAEAVALFCYQARKFLGALVVVLGGLDTLVFTGGIGEHAAPVRQRICRGLEFLGIQLDAAANDAASPIISSSDSTVSVRVIPTDEDLMIARHTRRLLWEQGATDVSL
jgi:acetate kinase